MNISLVHKHSLEAGIRVAACQDFLIELKNLMQVGHRVFEQREQLWQAEMGHLRGHETNNDILYLNYLLKKHKNCYLF